MIYARTKYFDLRLTFGNLFFFLLAGSGPDTTEIAKIVGPTVVVLAIVGVLVTFIVVRRRRRVGRCSLMKLASRAPSRCLFDPSEFILCV